MVDRNLSRCIEDQSARDQEGKIVHTVVVGSVGNGIGAGAWVTPTVVNGAGPITTDGDVDDD